MSLTLSASLTRTLDGDNHTVSHHICLTAVVEYCLSETTEATERRPAVCGDDASRRFQFLPAVVFEPCFFHIAKAKAIVASEGHHVSVHTNIDVSRMIRYLKGNMLKSAEDGSVEEVNPWELFLWPQYNEVNVESYENFFSRYIV